MAWMAWKLWGGSVTNARIRVPVTRSVGMSGYGQSLYPLLIKSGAIGTVRNILPEGASKPRYVLFQTPMNHSLAAEVVFRKSDNTDAMWKELRNDLMPKDECVVVITYPQLDTVEIEYKG